MSTILLNLIKNNKDLILKYGGYLGLIFVVLVFFGSYCYNWGQESIQEKWNQEKESYEQQIRTLKDEYYLKELTYREENTKIQKELADAKKEYEVALVTSTSDFNERLRQSESRAKFYQRQAESRTSGCGNIASITSRFDSSLTEGIQLVKDLTELIRLRDRQLQAVGQRLINEKNLTE